VIIYARYMAQFLDIVEELVHRGLTFEADASTFTIKLTGGF